MTRAPARWLRRRAGRLALWWLPVFAVSALGGWWLAPAARGQQAAVSPTAPGQAGAGQALYRQNCAACHGITGTGTSRGPSLQGVGAASVDFQLTTGRMPKRDTPNPTPPYKAELSPADIRALDQYVTALIAHGGPPIPTVSPDTGDVGQGQRLYSENCAACHGWGGSGGQLNDRSIPSVVDATPTQMAEAVRTGPNQMPVFGTAALTDNQVNSLAAYLGHLQHPLDKGGDPLSHVGPVAEGAVAFLIGLTALLGVTRWIGKRG